MALENSKEGTEQGTEDATYTEVDANAGSPSGEEESAIEALKKKTEYKAPSEHSPESGWKFDDEKQEGDDDELGEAAEKLKKPKIPEEVKKASAETATLLFDEFLQLIGNPIITHKFNKKFSDEEKEIILDEDIEFKELEALDEKQRVLKKKWEHNLKVRDKKLKAIPLDAGEEKRVFTSFYNYFKVTDKSLDPGWLLAASLISITIDRTIEVTSN